jgi:hypothetical protein
MSFIEVSSGVRERSVPLIMGQVLSLVAAALGICALTTWLGRDLAFGTARIFSFVGFGMLIAQTFVPALRRGSLLDRAAMTFSLAGGPPRGGTTKPWLPRRGTAKLRSSAWRNGRTAALRTA